MIVNVRLNLPKVYQKLTLWYNTFEKVSYDKYFMASVLSHTKNHDEVIKLIDQISGNGSLNEHFQKLYKEINSLGDQELKNIIKDSLYPIVKYEPHNFLYMPLVNVSLFQKKTYHGDLKNDSLFLYQLMDEGGTYIKHEYEIGETKMNPDNYLVNILDSKIEVKIDKTFHEIDPTEFASHVVKDIINTEEYKGIIHSDMIGEDWIQLTKSSFNNIKDTRDYYYENGDHIGIFAESAKKTIIAHKWGIYWIKEITYKYQDLKNSDLCEKVANHLMESGRINEIKNKTIIDILKNINRDKQQEIINHILSKKDVKELALNGLFLIDKGFEKGWNIRAIEAFYKYHETEKQLLSIYKIDSTLEYTIDDLNKINKVDREILIDPHKQLVIEYKKNVKEIKKSIDLKSGTMLNSGIRENMKQMKSDDDTKKLKKLLNNIAHNKKDYNDKNLEELIIYEKVILDTYVLYEKVLFKWQNEYKKED